jgi:hypothetical protein
MHLMGSDLRLPPVPGSEIIRPPRNGGLFSIIMAEPANARAWFADSSGAPVPSTIR